MSFSTTAYVCSWRERLLSACLFEVLAIVLSTALVVWLAGRDVGTMSVGSVFVAVIALLWNIAFN